MKKGDKVKIIPSTGIHSSYYYKIIEIHEVYESSITAYLDNKLQVFSKNEIKKVD